MREIDSQLRLAILITGGGTTMERIIQENKVGRLQGQVNPVIVISSNPDAGGIKKAKDLGVPVEVVQRRDFEKGEVGLEAFGLTLLAILAQYNPDAISQNGWLPLTPPNVIDKYPEIFNQHPAPLDSDNLGEDGKPLGFGGEGMHGLAPHAAVLEFQRLTARNFPTESTIHRVTKNYDQGGVVFRLEVPVEEDATPETLQQRVLPFEHEAQIIFWESYHQNNGQVPVLHRVESLIRPGEEEFLKRAVVYAREKYPQG